MMVFDWFLIILMSILIVYWKWFGMFDVVLWVVRCSRMIVMMLYMID